MDDITAIRDAYFDVCEDGILLYQDRAIGRYENTEHGLQVRLRRDQHVLELSIRGTVVETFSLWAGAKQACMAASAAYFAEVAELSRKGGRARMCPPARSGRLRLVS